MSTRKAARKIAKAKVVGMAPDVCKTPMGGATPPVPYGVTAKLHLSSSVSPNVNFTQCPAFTVESHTSKTWGDEPGVANGVKSGTVGGKAEPISKSSTVRVNGNWLIRHDDLFYLNEKNTVGKLVYPGGSPAPGVSGPGRPPTVYLKIH
ncbi:MAG: type IV secretion protein Rhs [Proteobacteria bacterium]|nr:MAG: type IV secretion protein Rhs [Pseudomonadota bacterium]